VNGGGHEALVAFLTSETKLPAAFVGPGGRVVATNGDPPGAETCRQAALAALRHELPRAIGDGASAFGVTASVPTTTLVVGAAMRDIPDETRLLIEQIAAYSAFEDARTRALEDARRAMAAELIYLVLSDQISERAFLARVSALRLDPTKPLAVIASDLSIELLSYAGAAAQATFVVAEHDSCRVLLAEDPSGELLDEIERAVTEAGEEPVLGYARPVSGAAALRRSLAEASAALKLARARPEGTRIVREAEIGSHELLLELLEPRELTAYRDALLGPLEQWDREHGSSLVETLRRFLECGGHWREAAASLHIHHNTLRYRLDRVEQLTGLDVSETSSRVDLFLALAADARERPRADD
jgi:sugar diacid utilization regulator